jgi:hypothetical protein
VTGSERTARLALLVADEPDEVPGTPTPWLRRLCRAAARHLPASGVGVCVVSDDGLPRPLAASDRVAEELDELQFVLGEGPCVDACTSRRPVLEPDLGSTTRWPGYARAALDRDVGAVFAFPLQVGAARLGALDVYRSRSGSLGRESVADASSFAELAVGALLAGQDAAGHGAVEPELEHALENGLQIYQAQGMIMVDLGISLPEAMSRLRAYAFAHGRRPAAVAGDIVAGRLVLEADPT